MGNAASGAATRVISGDGSPRREYSSRRLRHATAGELMLDNPGQFVCDSSQLAVGCRIPGLAADAELKPGRLYFLLPVDLLYSVLTEDEMAVFARRISSAARSGSYISRKIFPVLSEFCLVPPEAEKVVVVDPTRRNGWADRVEMYSKRQSWRPALDTIQEVDGSPKYSRTRKNI